MERCDVKCPTCRERCLLVKDHTEEHSYSQYHRLCEEGKGWLECPILERLIGDEKRIKKLELWYNAWVKAIEKETS